MMNFLPFWMLMPLVGLFRRWPDTLQYIVPSLRRAGMKLICVASSPKVYSLTSELGTFRMARKALTVGCTSATR